MPELILSNGIIRTQDKNNPVAEALAISDGRILAVGNDGEIRSMISPRTEVIDLRGRLALPGMTDCHIHFLPWAMNRRHVPLLAEAASLRDVLKMVASARNRVPPGTWITGWGLDENSLSESRLPTRWDLDSVSPVHPVFLRRRDGHMAVANSQALILAAIKDNASDLPDDVFDRDESEKLTGILKEHAADLVASIIPDPTLEETVDAMRHAIPMLHAVGLTGIHDVRNLGEKSLPFRAWQRLDELGALNLRCSMFLSGEHLKQALDLGLRTGFGNERLKVGHVKYFTDGSMGSQTACMEAPYQDGRCGMAVFSLDNLAEAVKKAEKGGLAVAIHAIGDRANREVITMFENLSGARSSFESRIPHRIEHAQVIRPEDLARLAKLDITASVQPLHVTDEISIHVERIGSRSRWAFIFRSMIDGGVRVVFGSDCPVSDPNPIWGIHAAVTRRRRDGSPAGGWYPAQRITVAEAVWAYTMEPALGCGREEDLGSISRGKLADIVVLNKDIYNIDTMAIPETQVDLTIFNGQVVYER